MDEQVRNSIIRRHVSNIEKATTHEQLFNLLKNHVRLVNMYHEQWRHNLIERINQRIKEINA